MRILVSNVIRSFAFRLSMDLTHHPVTKSIETAQSMANMGYFKKTERHLADVLKGLTEFAVNFEGDANIVNPPTEQLKKFKSKAEGTIQKINSVKEHVEKAIDFTKQGNDTEIDDHIGSALKEFKAIGNL